MDLIPKAWRRKNDQQVISFKNLRRLIGLLGMALPLVCWLGGLLVSGLRLGPSISSYYYTNVRDAFTGVIVGMALFLVTYRGYELVDDIVSTATGLVGLGIAVFPCYDAAVERTGFFLLDAKASNLLHSACAGFFFLLLAVNSIFIFTLTDEKGKLPPRKRMRNFVYVAMGVVILACLAVLGILHLLYDQATLDTKTWVFALETVLLEAFGVSWLVKGGTFLRDRP